MMTSFQFKLLRMAALLLATGTHAVSANVGPRPSGQGPGPTPSYSADQDSSAAGGVGIKCALFEEIFEDPQVYGVHLWSLLKGLMHRNVLMYAFFTG